MLFLFGWLAMVCSLMAGCISTAGGGRKFDPVEGLLRTDEQIDEWLEQRDYPTHHSRERDDKTKYPGSQP